MNEQEIEVLEFPESIRTRPGMYIGKVENPDVIFREVLDNSIDEGLGKYADQIYVQTNNNGYNFVADNGRGMPIRWNEKYQRTALRVASEVPHSGSKFKKTTASVGLNGVGTKATNALSEIYVLCSKITELNYNTSTPLVKSEWTKRSGEELFYFVEYNKGHVKLESVRSRQELEEAYNIVLPEGMSTMTFFIPDAEIFDSIKCRIPKRNILNAKFIYKKFHDVKVDFHYEGELLEEELEPYKYEFISRVELANKEYQDHVDFYITFEFDEDLSMVEYTGSVNSLVTNVGYHVNMAKDLITSNLKKKYHITHKHLENGLRFFVVCLATENDFDSQTKTRLVKISGMDYGEYHQMDGEVLQIFKDHNDEVELHVERLNEFAASVDEIATIDKIKGLIRSDDPKAKSFLPSNVFDATSSDRSNCELYIVEGRSAGGTLVAARDKEVHAILQLKGKPMNTVYLDFDSLLENQEMSDLLQAIGMGLNDYYTLDNPRYSKIILAADADPDGASINALTLGTLAYHATFLINAGMVYIARAPLYRQDGVYHYDDSELDKDREFVRYKGLGEMDADELKESMLDPENRQLIQVTIDGFDEAISILTSRHARRKLMTEHGIITDPYHLDF